MFVMSRVQTGDPNMLTTEGKVFLDEQLEIRRLSMKGPAISSDTVHQKLCVIRRILLRYSSTLKMRMR